MATETYNSAQTIREATTPIGMSRAGFLDSSAAVETESNPKYVKKTMAAPAMTPETAWKEWMIVLEANVFCATNDEQHDGSQLDENHEIVCMCALANAANQQNRQNHQYDKRRQIEPRSRHRAVFNE